MSLDDLDGHLRERMEEGSRTMTKAVKGTWIAAGIGAIVGAVGGLWLGNSINDYFDVLKNAPAAIRYAVDGACMLGVGGGGASLLGGLKAAFEVYKMHRDFDKGPNYKGERN